MRWSAASKGSWLRVYPAALLCLVLALAFGLRARNIAESLPYCRHADENTWMTIAWRMMRDGDANPRRFTKPSLPAYLMVAGSSAGLLRAQLRGEAQRVQDFGKSAVPSYRVPSAAEVAKWLFAAFSVGAMAVVGVLARRISGRPELLYAAPALALASSSYFLLSWSYMNVDTIGTFFILCAVLHVVSWHLRAAGSSPRRDLVDVAIAGALCGLTLGSKYNLFPIAVPCVLQLLFLGRRRFFTRALLFGVVTVLTFLATTPYAIFDHQRFVANALREARHYATGHMGMEPHRGFSAFFAYGRTLWENWGLVLVLAAVGLARLLRDNWRLALLTFSFPFLFLFYMSLQRVVFERNIMSLHLFVALAASLGALALARLVHALIRRRFALGPNGAGAAAAVVALALVAACTPWSEVRQAYQPRVESRNIAARWLTQNLKKRTPVLIDSRLGLDTRKLRGRGQIATFDSSKRKLAQPAAGLAARKDFVAVLAADRFEQSPLRNARPLARFGGHDFHRSGRAGKRNPDLVIVSGEDFRPRSSPR